LQDQCIGLYDKKRSDQLKFAVLSTGRENNSLITACVCVQSDVKVLTI